MPESLPPVSEEQKQQVQQRKDLFIQEVFCINDAGIRETINSGWGHKGKLAWLSKVVERYRADLHTILRD
jgi:hypothetical protein